MTALAEYDVEAITVGGYTSGFKAEAPGLVAVVVRLADFERAKEAMAEIRQQQARSIGRTWTWRRRPKHQQSQTNGRRNPKRRVSRHFWWTLELLGIAICLVVWLFTRQLTPPLVYAIVALALIGILPGAGPLGGSPAVMPRYNRRLFRRACFL